MTAPVAGAILPDFDALKEYEGPATLVHIPGIGSYRLSADETDADDGGTIIQIPDGEKQA